MRKFKQKNPVGVKESKVLRISRNKATGIKRESMAE
jgi:hypothetical protein